MSVEVAVTDPLPIYRRGIMAVLDRTSYSPAAPRDLLTWLQGRQRRLVFLTLQSAEDWDLLHELHAASPDLLLIAVLVDVGTATFVRALLSGATTAIPRDAPPEVVKVVFEAVLNGQSLLPLDVVRELASPGGGPSRQSGTPTQQEIGWLRDLANGRTVAQLAERSGYSERAMFRLLRDLYSRMRVDNRTAALMHAQEQGWL